MYSMHLSVIKREAIENIPVHSALQLAESRRGKVFIRYLRFNSIIRACGITKIECFEFSFALVSHIFYSEFHAFVLWSEEIPSTETETET